MISRAGANQVTPDEEQHLRQLGQALERVEQWESLTGTLTGAWKAAAGSDLAGDDTTTDPYHISSAAWSSTMAAISHLGCLRDSLFHFDGPNHVRSRIHTHGQLTLVRGALENASMTLWLLQPSERTERVQRRLQQEWEEATQQEAVREFMGQPRNKTQADRLQQLAGIATKAGANPAKIKKSRPGYGAIVQMAGDHYPAGAKAAFIMWKACSAIAHGELRGMIAYLSNSSLGSPTPGVSLNIITADFKLLATGGLMALAATKAALELYGKRAGRPFDPAAP